MSIWTLFARRIGLIGLCLVLMLALLGAASAGVPACCHGATALAQAAGPCGVVGSQTAKAMAHPALAEAAPHSDTGLHSGTGPHSDTGGAPAGGHHDHGAICAFLCAGGLALGALDPPPYVTGPPRRIAGPSLWLAPKEQSDAPAFPPPRSLRL